MTTRLALVFILVLALARSLAASGHIGQVTFGGLPVPGAIVTAMQGTRTLTTTTDQQGVYRFADLVDGVWEMRVEMRGFAPLSRDVTVAPDAMPVTWELMLLPFEEIAKTARVESASAGSTPPPAAPQARNAAAPPSRPRGFQRADVSAAPRGAAAPTATAAAPPPADPPAESADASDGFLINGSVNNGAASPFAQPAAFGNNRRRPGSVYTGALGLLADTSAWDTRPFSFTGQHTPKPEYNDVHFIGMFQGPITIPGVRNRLNFFGGYQRTSNHNATTQSTVVPTALERGGDFSQTTDALGRTIRVVDPLTGQPFAGNAIPADRISGQAAELLRYYPQPNVNDGGRFNYQAPVLQAVRQDSVQSRMQQFLTQRNQLTGNLAYQRTSTDSTSLFGFNDNSLASTLDATVIWTHRLTPFAWVRPKYQFTQITNEATPYFADRQNVSGDAGIAGNDQEPQNWGPPMLVFASGYGSLTDALPAFTRNTTNVAGAELFMARGRHNLTIGGDARLQRIGIDSQQDPRGRFSFNGAYTGWDLADFLLGVPRTSSIAYGNADKRFAASSFDAYLTDDYRVNPSVTINAGVRWEYEGPMTEQFGRLVNLDVAPGFTAVEPVLASDPTGAVTGRAYDSSLLHPDRFGIQPRTAVAWRPVPGSSLVVRAGYGIYRNTNVYLPIATLLAQQPPLSHTFSLENSLVHPVTMATAFTVAAPGTANTFAVDPDFRPGYAHNWQVAVQRDLPASLTVTATYLGTKGSHLMQEFLPNTYPLGAENPCPTCPVGFAYLTSDGHSVRNAAQLQLRRRLRNGLTWTTQYTLAKATDDATAFTGASLNGAAIAQDWRNLGAEQGPSSFDQRHQLTATVEYTTGVGVRGGGLMTGLKGAILKGWTMSAQLTTGSGLPFSPIVLTQVPGTGVVGSMRAQLTGAPIDATGAGYYFNPAAFALPTPGQWGDAGRNSVRGPAQFNLNASVTRTFPWGARRNWDWRIDATNILNRVTYSGIDTVVGTPQFGLANAANPMRKIQTSLRLRF